jgi:hypothetical protein
MLFRPLANVLMRDTEYEYPLFKGWMYQFNTKNQATIPNSKALP